jgi:hypothetical protein
MVPTPRSPGIVYEWKKEQPFQRWVGDAQEIGDRIEAIWEQKNGDLQPLDIVEDARHVTSPLHPNFEWDDTLAARHYREHTARNLLGAIVRVSMNNEPLANPVRAFVNVNHGTTSRSYMPVIIAMQDPDVRESVLRQALNELSRWKKKYADYQEFANVVDAIENVTLETILETVEV